MPTPTTPKPAAPASGPRTFAEQYAFARAVIAARSVIHPGKTSQALTQGLSRMTNSPKHTKQVTFKFPRMAVWEKLLTRWSEFPGSAEKNLICAVIAQAITDHNESGRDFRLVADGSGFWGLMLDKYCRLIALDSQFVREQILTAARRDGETVTVPV